MTEFKSQRLIKIVLVSLITAFAFGGGAFSVESLTKEQRQQSIEIRQRVFYSGKRIDRIAIGALTPEERQITVAYLKEMINRDKDHFTGVMADQNPAGFDLAALGDQEGLEIVARRYRTIANSNELQILNDPKMIPLIGEVLFRNEPLYTPAGDTFLVGAQKKACDDILGLLIATHAFSEKVEEWAREMQQRNEGSETQKLNFLRTWYRANETDLKKSDFREVKPGETAVSSSMTTRESTKPTGPLRNQSQQFEGAASAKSISGAKSIEHVSKKGFPLIGIFVGISLAMLILIVLKRGR